MLNSKPVGAVLGFVYGGFLILYAALGSGGGHFSFFFTVSMSPGFLGIVLWPLLGWLAVKPGIRDRQAIRALLIAHYAVFALLYVTFGSLISDLEVLGGKYGGSPVGILGSHAPWIVAYLAGQVFFWRRIFWKH